ncbi:MAG: TolC family protein [Maricaulis sp.]|uniref:TolC family protein n=1 Tax=Maricaulis sp. TaxID=1486257 RepID=UPI001B2B78C7|nr:TolC family protein [Maricaulis sp.]MBO6729719.1 TolC family protein [Maricaulis sp.]MBO6848409.1 TolC family protein [Maricaulis sp.]MBO6878219.1 TolC family protein [Maricaulis sp.]
MSLSELMRVGIGQSPEVAVAQSRLDQAEADIDEARSLRRPQVTSFGRTGVGDTGLTSSQIENQVGVRVSQRVYDFGDARLAINAAEFNSESLAYSLASQEAQTAFTIAFAYLAGLEAEEMIGVISQRRDYFARQEAAVTELLARGGATRAERAQVSAQRAEAEADVLELQSQQQQAESRLRAYTGLLVNTCAVGPVTGELEGGLAGLSSVDLLWDAVFSRNPEIAAAQRAVRSLDAQRERERRERLPVIDVVGISSYTYDDQREDWEARDRVGIDVSVPLYTGNAIGARRDRAQARLQQSENELRQLQRDLGERAEVSYRRVLALEAQLSRRQDVAQNQREYFEAIEGEFEFGLGTLPDLVEARLAYESAALDVVRLQFELARERLELLLLADRLPL